MKCLALLCFLALTRGAVSAPGAPEASDVPGLPTGSWWAPGGILGEDLGEVELSNMLSQTVASTNKGSMAFPHSYSCAWRQETATHFPPLFFRYEAGGRFALQDPEAWHGRYGGGG